MLRFMALLVFLLGAGMIGLGGWMAAHPPPGEKIWGWFIILGIILIYAGLLVASDDSPKR